ncbi:MAG: DNA-binding protein [Nitrospirae bacterium]|nr:DNA-binding protein [Nitrospirota bacterium]
MMRRILTLSTLILTSVFLVSVNIGCDSSKKTTEPQQQQQTKPATGPITKETHPSISGKVVETMNSGGYTYVRLQKDGKDTWVAINEAKIEIGAEMAFYPGDVMNNFTSKTLNRTFDSVIFSPGVVGQEANTTPPFMSKGAIKTEIQDVKVEKAAGSDAYTINELYQKKDTLNKKTVTVKGMVVKVSTGIMGKNWVHIQDGTAKDDLVVTTDTVPLEGSVVTVKGTLSKDKDFGAGYVYAVLIEDAAISK